MNIQDTERWAVQNRKGEWLAFCTTTGSPYWTTNPEEAEVMPKGIAKHEAKDFRGHEVMHPRFLQGPPTWPEHEEILRELGI